MAGQQDTFTRRRKRWYSSKNAHRLAPSATDVLDEIIFGEAAINFANVPLANVNIVSGTINNVSIGNTIPVSIVNVGALTLLGSSIIINNAVLPDGDLTIAPDGNGDIILSIPGAGGVQVTNLTANEVVFNNASGTLDTDTGFEYNPGTDTLMVDNLQLTGTLEINAISSATGNDLTIITNANDNITIIPGGTGILTLNKVTSFTASGNLDIGAFEFRALTLVADGLATGRVVFTTTDGELTAESGFEYNTTDDILTTANTKITGTVKTSEIGTSVATSGTATAAEILGGIITTNTAGGSGTVTLPTAATIIAAVPDATTGDVIKCLFVAHGADGNDVTLVSNTGLTMSGTPRVIGNTSRLVYFRITGGAAITVF